MINDPSINVYEVVAEAESYFQNIDKNAKGSGWKAYNRWLYENEPKFYTCLLYTSDAADDLTHV